MSHVAPNLHRKWLSRIHTVQLAIWTLLFTLFLLLYPSETFVASSHAFTLWWKTSFPLLFPFYVFSTLIMMTGGFQAVARLLRWRTASTFFWLGLTTDAIVFANQVATWQNTNILNRKQAESMLTLLSTTPIYFITVIIHFAILQQTTLLFPLLVSHVTASLLLYILIHKRILNQVTLPRQPQQPLGLLINLSMKQATQAMMQLAGWMIAAAIVCAFIVFVWDVPRFYGYSLFDLSLGADKLSESFIRHDARPLTLSLLSAAIGWGGLTSLLRLYSGLTRHAIRFSRIILYKGIHAVLNGALCWLFCIVFRL